MLYNKFIKESKIVSPFSEHYNNLFVKVLKLIIRYNY